MAPASTFDCEKGEQTVYAGSGTAADPFQVKFNEGDPTNPFNFSGAKRWTMVAVAAVATLCKWCGGVELGGVDRSGWVDPQPQATGDRTGRERLGSGG